MFLSLYWHVTSQRKENADTDSQYNMHALYLTFRTTMFLLDLDLLFVERGSDVGWDVWNFPVLGTIKRQAMLSWILLGITKLSLFMDHGLFYIMSQCTHNRQRMQHLNQHKENFTGSCKIMSLVLLLHIRRQMTSKS